MKHILSVTMVFAAISITSSAHADVTRYSDGSVAFSDRGLSVAGSVYPFCEPYSGALTNEQLQENNDDAQGICAVFGKSRLVSHKRVIFSERQCLILNADGSIKRIDSGQIVQSGICL